MHRSTSLAAMTALTLVFSLAETPPAPSDIAPTQPPVATTTPPALHVALPVTDPTLRQVGRASWYGGPHQGRRTADGERFDEGALTAAHRSLPFNSWVLVRNLENNRIAVVRINDRGPYIKGRIIDLTRRAAEELGMKKDGLDRVRIEQIPDPTGVYEAYASS